MTEIHPTPPEFWDKPGVQAPAEGFATVLHSHRLRARLTQENLAGLAGVSPRSVRNIERGRVRMPRAETVRLLAEALGLTGPDLEAFAASASERYWHERSTGQGHPGWRDPGGGEPVPALGHLPDRTGTGSANGLSRTGCCRDERRRSPRNRRTTAAVVIALGVALSPVLARRLFPGKRIRVSRPPNG